MCVCVCVCVCFKIRRSTKRIVFFLFIYFVLIYVLYMCIFPACCFRQRTYVAQGLVNGILSVTWTHSCFTFKWPLVGPAGLYGGYSPSFLECVYFGLLLPLFDIWYVYSCVCVCVCVCSLGLEWFWVSVRVK